MASHGPLRSNCERARAWASLELDAELSELERALLESHLSRCVACAAVVADMRALTRLVRGAELERPERTIFEPRARHATRGSGVALRVALAATLAALAAGLGALTGSLSGEPAQEPPVVTDVAFLPASSSESREVHAQRGAKVIDLDRQRAFPPGRLGGNV